MVLGPRRLKLVSAAASEMAPGRSWVGYGLMWVIPLAIQGCLLGLGSQSQEGAQDIATH